MIQSAWPSSADWPTSKAVGPRPLVGYHSRCVLGSVCQDELFSFGENSKAAYVLTQGQMRYWQDTNDGLVTENRIIQVAPGCYT
eukprot:732474-Amphidinium_carterae.1